MPDRVTGCQSEVLQDPEKWKKAQLKFGRHLTSQEAHDLALKILHDAEQGRRDVADAEADSDYHFESVEYDPPLTTVEDNDGGVLVEVQFGNAPVAEKVRAHGATVFYHRDADGCLIGLRVECHCERTKE